MSGFSKQIHRLGPLSVAQATVGQWLLGLLEFVHIVCPCFFLLGLYLMWNFSVFVLDLLEFSFLFHNLSTSVSSAGQLCIFGQGSHFCSSHNAVSGIIFILWVKSCPSLAARIFCLLGADVSGSQAVDIPPPGMIFTLDFRLRLLNKCHFLQENWYLWVIPQI